MIIVVQKVRFCLKVHLFGLFLACL